MSRSSGRFATVYAAGCLAIRYKIFLWKRKELLHAILSCQLDGLRIPAVAAGNTEQSVGDLRQKLIEYLREQRADFKRLMFKPELGSHKFGKVPGYIDKVDGADWYYLTAEQFRDIVGSASHAALLKEQLIKENLMAKPLKRGLVVQRRIFRGGKGSKNYRWVCAFKADILDAQD